MTTLVLLALQLILTAAGLALAAVMAVRLRRVTDGRDDARERLERLERTLKEELTAGRREAGEHARLSRDDARIARDDMSQRFDGLRAQLTAEAKHESERIRQGREDLAQDVRRGREDLAHMLEVMLTQAAEQSRFSRDDLTQRLEAMRAQIGLDAKQGRIETTSSFGEMALLLKAELEAFTRQFEISSGSLRKTVGEQLANLQTDNAVKLEEMRKTVAEKLEGTLERRLGDSFKLVSERLEQVHKGLGEMQSLAIGVGDLKKVMTNVKTRGTWGEIQLGSLLGQILSPEQFSYNVQTKKDSPGRVEYAIKMPGKDGGAGNYIWLPIDAKFPLENYHRLVEAQEKADPEAAEIEARLLEVFIKAAAKEICDKYVSPPDTTDFGVMYLPTESLFAEVARRVGLVEHIQRECRVIIAGPTTLAALLNSLQMGFRTLAIQKRSSEVWEILGAVKSEFSKFDDVLQKVEKKLQEAGNVIGSVQTRSRVITRKLRQVQELPVDDATALLAIPEADVPVELGEELDA